MITTKNHKKNNNFVLTPKLKKILIERLENLMVENHGMKTDIDSYNYGIYNCIEEINKQL